MKQSTATERSALVAGIALIILGVWLFVWPQKATVAHALTDTEGTPAGVVTERVNKTGSRVYGVISCLFGLGLVSLSVWGRSPHKV